MSRTPGDRAVTLRLISFALVATCLGAVTQAQTYGPEPNPAYYNSSWQGSGNGVKQPVTAESVPAGPSNSTSDGPYPVLSSPGSVSRGVPAPPLYGPPCPPGYGGYRRVLPPEFAQGEYVERDRVRHIPSYRLRADDQLELVYRETRNEQNSPYRFGVGDKLKIDSLLNAEINRELLVVQPDGSITVPVLGQVRAGKRTVVELREDLERRYSKYYKNPSITVTPIEMNTKLRDLLATVVARFGNGGQVRQARVTPDGYIQLPVIGSIPVQGMTIDEAAREISERYALEVDGVEVMPVLVQRAPRFVYVVGEVRTPGRYSLEAPTSVMQAISLAGGWNVGANLYQVIVFRRDDNWQLMATMLNVWNPLYGNTLKARDDIWLGDSDVVVVPKQKILVADDYINLIFTRGIYGVVPFQGITIGMAKLSSL